MLIDVVRPEVWHSGIRKEDEGHSPAAAALAFGPCVSAPLPQNHLNHPHSHSHEKKPQREPRTLKSFLSFLTLKRLLKTLQS